MHFVYGKSLREEGYRLFEAFDILLAYDKVSKGVEGR
jgi:hypothetical protein